ncbi:MAG TPA: hypothetical protein VKG26_01450 [Bacteroidia bacterium]|nr:hypothetical protein [Bacteroidia bacterium]
MEEPTTFEQETKPQGLKILCTLTFIYSSIVGIFALLFMLFAKPLFVLLRDKLPELEENAQIPEQQIEQLKIFLEKGSPSFIIACGVYLLVIGLSFFGAVQMWQNKYRGFVMYVGANLYFLISNAIGGVYLMAALDLLFIVLYFRHSKSLER